MGLLALSTEPKSKVVYNLYDCLKTQMQANVRTHLPLSQSVIDWNCVQLFKMNRLHSHLKMNV